MTTGADHEPTSRDEGLARADRLLAENQAGAAASVLNGLRSAGFSGADVLVRLGRAYTALRSLGLAERTYREALVQDPQDPAIALELTDVLLAAGRPSEAASVLDDLLAGASDDEEGLRVQGSAHQLYAEVRLRQGAVDQAIWSLKRAMRAAGATDRLRWRLALCLLDARRPEEALQEASSVPAGSQYWQAAQLVLGKAYLDLDPPYPSEALTALENTAGDPQTAVDAEVDRGYALALQQRWQEALHSFAAFLASAGADHPRRPEAHLRAAHASLALEQWPESRRHAADGARVAHDFERRAGTGRAEALREIAANCLYLRSLAELGLGQLEDAHDTARAVVLRHSGLRIAAETLAAQLLWQLSRYGEAWRSFDALLAHACPAGKEVPEKLSVDDTRTLHKVLHYVGREADADAWIQVAMQRYPTNVHVWYERVTFCVDMRDACPSELDSATARSASAAGALARPHTEVHGQSYWAREARAALRHARSLLDARLAGRQDLAPAPGSPAAVSLAAELQTLGQLHLAVGEYDSAERYLDESRTVHPDSRSSLVALGVLHLNLRQSGEATRWLRSAVAQDPDNVLVQQLLARALLHGHCFDDAEAIHRRTLVTAPENVDALTGLAQVLIGRAESLPLEDADAALVNLDEAARRLETVRKLQATMEAPSVTSWRASRKLTPRELAAVHYDLGYVRARQFDAQLRESSGLLRRADGQLLREAEKRMREALDLDPELLSARQALDRLRIRRASAAPTPISRAAQRLLLGALFVVLAVVQLLAYDGRPPWADGTVYTGMTLGLLVLIVAAVCLPALTKLHVAGVALEKSGADHGLPTVRGPELRRAVDGGRLPTVVLSAPDITAEHDARRADRPHASEAKKGFEASDQPPAAPAPDAASQGQQAVNPDDSPRPWTLQPPER